MKRNSIFGWALVTISAGISMGVVADTPVKTNPESPPSQSATNETSVAEPATPKVQAPSNNVDSGKLSPVERMLSWQAVQMIKMAESGIEPAIIKAYIEHSHTVKPPSADEVIYLRDHGISSEIITAYINRASQLQAMATPPTPDNQDNQGPLMAPSPQVSVSPAITPPMMPEVASPDSPPLVYDYPSASEVYVSATPYPVVPPYYYGGFGLAYFPRWHYWPSPYLGRPVHRFGGASHFNHGGRGR